MANKTLIKMTKAELIQEAMTLAEVQQRNTTLLARVESLSAENVTMSNLLSTISDVLEKASWFCNFFCKKLAEVKALVDTWKGLP